MKNIIIIVFILFLTVCNLTSCTYKNEPQQTPLQNKDEFARRDTTPAKDWNLVTTTKMSTALNVKDEKTIEWKFVGNVMISDRANSGRWVSPRVFRFVSTYYPDSIEVEFFPEGAVILRDVKGHLMAFYE
jgi:hypothetical protein